MEQDQNTVQQKPVSRRRYSPAAETHVPEVQHMQEPALSPVQQESAIQQTARRRAHRNRTENSITEKEPVSAPVQSEMPVSAVFVAPDPVKRPEEAQVLQEPLPHAQIVDAAKPENQKDAANPDVPSAFLPGEPAQEKHIDSPAAKLHKPERLPETKKTKSAAISEKPHKEKNQRAEKAKPAKGKALLEKPAAIGKKKDAASHKHASESFDMRVGYRPDPTKDSPAAEEIAKRTAATPAAGKKPARDETVQPKPTASKPEAVVYPSQYTSQKQEQQQESKHPRKTKPAVSSEKPPLKKRLPYYIGIALCSLVLIISGTMLIRYYTQIWRANHASNQLRNLYNRTTDVPAATPDPQPQQTADDEEPILFPAEETPAPTPTPEADRLAAFRDAWPKKYPGNEQMHIQERFDSLRHQNKDIVGWLTIEGVVDEPVFQRDNSFYLTHDATGAKNATGALFLDEGCNLRTVPMMALIHGHNMKEGAMFGSLKKYKVKDASFYKSHPYVTFDTLYEKATYVIFAVAEVNIVPGNTHYFPFWHQFSFGTEESFDHFVLLAKEYSRFKVDIDVQPGDRLLTLATCSSENDDLRLIVMARMLRENEDTIKLSNSIYSATAK